MSSLSQGVFITLEGIEGAGKSTHLQDLAAFLRARGIAVVQTREPGGSALGERVRAIFLDPGLRSLTADSELLLLYAARAQHVAEVIRPALASGSWVLCDRFEDSTYAYQGGGRAVPAARIAALSAWTLAGLAPDLTLWFDVDPALGLARARQRSTQDRLEQETLDFFSRARGVFEARWRLDPGRIVRLDADEALETVSAAAIRAVREKFSL